MIIRVFPERTSYTPVDSHVFIGPPMFSAMLPPHDEVHISCIFTWDKKKCAELAYQWDAATDKPVKLGGLGGPAFGSPANDFNPGMYIKPNIVFTTRGCNNNCPWCGVPKLEGPLRELHIVPGNWIQDNNILQANQAHKEGAEMREYKFRGKRIDNGAWESGGIQIGGLPHHEGMAYIIDKSTNYLTPVDPATVGQLTGYTDDDNNELYEGDIIKQYFRGAGSIYHLSEIRYYQAAFMACSLKTKAHTPLHNDTNRHYRLIGNIHDNPEIVERRCGDEKN